MIHDGVKNGTVRTKLAPNADKSILISNTHSFQHSGKYFKSKPIYHQTDGADLAFIPNYHRDTGLVMTPIPKSIRQAIIGVYMYKPEENKSSGQVKGIFVY